MEKIVVNAIENLFDTFNSNKLQYVVLRNYKKLPEDLDSKDIDIMIEKKDSKLAWDLLVKVMKKSGAKYYYRKRERGLISSCFFWNHSLTTSLQIDLFTDFGFKGRIFLSAHEVLSEKKEFKNFYIPDPSHEIIISLLKPFMLSGEVKEKYINQYHQLLRDSSLHTRIEKTLGKCTGEKIAKKLILLLSEGNRKEIIKMKKAFDTYSHLICFFRNPPRYIFNLLEHYYIMSKQILLPYSFIFFCYNCGSFPSHTWQISCIHFKYKDTKTLLNIFHSIISAIIEKRSKTVSIIGINKKYEFLSRIIPREFHISDKNFFAILREKVVERI